MGRIVAIISALLIVAGIGFGQWGAQTKSAPLPKAIATGGNRIHFPVGQEQVVLLGDGRRQTMRSFLNVATPMNYGQYLWDDDGIPPGELWARVDLKRQLISVFRGGHEIGTAVILYGSDNTPTPLGVFPVLEKRVDYHSRTYDAPMPYMMRLTNDGVALHASEMRRNAVTHGCIGLPMPFAKLLFAQLAVGDPVLIVGGDVTTG